MRLSALPVLFAVASLSWSQPPDRRHWSPDHRRYAINLRGQPLDRGVELERFLIYSDAGKQLAIAHVWLTEPTGTMRAGIRGCENWGWVDSSRIFCEGTINPSTGVYLVFQAETGRELGEYIGTNFTWSPNRTLLANSGNVPHFSRPESKSDSVEIQGKHVYPPDDDHGRHWFRSDLVWSADSRNLAVVDQRPDGSIYLLAVPVNGSAAFEQKLHWLEPLGEWPPDRDFSLRWTRGKLTVSHRGEEEAVAIPG